MWHWDPRFMQGKLGSRDETRASLVHEGRLQDAAANITVPTLLVRGRVSDLLSEEGAQDLLRLVPHAEYVDVEGAGHMVAGDKNDLFNDAIVGFLDRLRTDARAAVDARVVRSKTNRSMLWASSTGVSPWRLWPASSKCSTCAFGQTAEELDLVVVVDHRLLAHAAREQQRHLDA